MGRNGSIGAASFVCMCAGLAGCFSSSSSGGGGTAGFDSGGIDVTFDAPQPSQDSGPAVDATSVYWLNPPEIVKIAK